MCKKSNIQIINHVSVFIAGLLIVIISGCEEKIDWDLEMQNEVRLVVDGKITNERKAHEVKLSLPVYEMNGDQKPFSGADVFISVGDTTYILEEDPTRPGTYLTDPDVKGEVDSTYTLFIRARNYEFTAIAKMAAVSQLQIPSYYKVSNEPPLYEVAFTGNNANSIIRLDLDWSSVPGYDTLDDIDNHAVVYGYYFGVLDVDANEIFSPNHERIQFPPGTYVEITKESMSDGYAEYLRGMLSETAWNGGLFDVKPGDPYTNLSRGALGYFAATAVVKGSLVFEP